MIKAQYEYEPDDNNVMYEGDTVEVRGGFGHRYIGWVVRVYDSDRALIEIYDHVLGEWRRLAFDAERCRKVQL